MSIEQTPHLLKDRRFTLSSANSFIDAIILPVSGISGLAVLVELFFFIQGISQ